MARLAEATGAAREVRLPFAAVFATFAFLTLSYALSAGPFRSPDEYNHFFRSYHVSEGKLVAQQKPGGLLGDRLPASLTSAAKAAAGYPDVPPARTSSDQIRSSWLVRDDGATLFTHFPGSGLYSPLAYLPSALGVRAGRITGAPPLAFLYLGRICNALAGALLLACAIRFLPEGVKPIGILALFPTWLFQMATLTPDAVTFGLMMLWIALLLRMRANAEPLSRALWGGAVVLAACVSQLRLPFPLLVLLVFIVPRARFATALRAATFYASVLIVAATPCLLWIALAAPLQVPLRPGVITEPSRQLAAALADPAHTFGLIATNLWQNALRYWQEAIGTFSWLEVRLPWWLLLAFTVAAIGAMSASRPIEFALTRRLRIMLIAAACAGVFASELLIYMHWNAFRAPHIEGYQGRYLLPCLLLLALGCANNLLGRHARTVRRIAVGVCLVGNVGALIVLARATWW